MQRHEYWTVREYAKEFDVTAQTVRYWIHTGQLQAVKQANGRYIILKPTEKAVRSNE